MSLFDDTVPPNTEPSRLGASRIRAILTALNSTIGQVFSKLDGTFATGWLGVGQLFSSSDDADDSKRPVITDTVKNGAITLKKLAASPKIFATNSAVKTVFGSATISGDLISDVPAGSVGTDQLQDASVTVAKLAVAAASRIYVGSYAGSNSAIAQVTAPGFKPDALILIEGTRHGFGIALLVEASGGKSDIHASWSTDSEGSYAAAVEWHDTGFNILPVNFHFNDGGFTHYYVALKI